MPSMTPIIQHIQNVAGAPGHWPDEFLAWYKREHWEGEHRAAAVFIGEKFAALAAEVERLRAQVPPAELTSSRVNDACWAFVEAMPHQLPGAIFNALKPALHAAICNYLAASPAAPAQQAAPSLTVEGWKLLEDGKTAIPQDWVPLRMEWEPGYPEDVAFGPVRLMERLKKWLDAHFTARQQAQYQASLPAWPDAEPVAWMFQHDEAGRNCFCANDGVNTVASFTVANPRLRYVCALYPARAQAHHPAQGVGELPPLPQKRRGAFCTKCHASFTPTSRDEHPLCVKCGYLAFAQDCDYSDDEMQAYARAALAQAPAAEPLPCV